MAEQQQAALRSLLASAASGLQQRAMAYPLPTCTLHGLTKSEVAEGWKCRWSYNPGHCASLLLPHGIPLSAEGAAAMQWHATLGVKSRHPFAAFNPSKVDEETLLLRIAPMATPSGVSPKLMTQLTQHRIVWLHRGEVKFSVRGEDPRGVWLDQWTLLVVYSRLLQKDRVRIFMRNMSDLDHGKEVALRFSHGSGLALHEKEKNWAPMVYDGQLFMSYALHPHHIVLSCKVISGICSLAYNTSSPSMLGRPLDPDSHKSDERLSFSTPSLMVRGRRIAVGHFHTAASAVYYHVLLEMQPSPPFAIISSSRPFRFFTRGCGHGHQDSRFIPGTRIPRPKVAQLILNSSASDAPFRLRQAVVEGLTCGPHAIQYVAGMYLMHDGNIALTYGVGDAAGMQTKLTLEQAFRLLSDSGDGRTHKYPFCIASRHNSGICDDTTCDQGQEGATLAACLTMSSSYPYRHLAPKERDIKVLTRQMRQSYVDQALHQAVRTGSLVEIAELTKLAIDLQSRTSNDHTAMHWPPEVRGPCARSSDYSSDPEARKTGRHPKDWSPSFSTGNSSGTAMLSVDGAYVKGTRLF